MNHYFRNSRKIVTEGVHVYGCGLGLNTIAAARKSEGFNVLICDGFVYYWK
jgi:hypothetical protein